MSIRDLARNTIDPAHNTVQFLGWRPAVTEPFNYDLYRMLIKPIRDDDRVHGNEFLKRFLTGPQFDFERTYNDIRGIRYLSDYRTTQARFLPYLLHLLGFTGDSATAPVIDNLSELDQRRLVYAAARIWKTKGTETAYEKAATLLGGIRVEIDDWFYYRWIALDEGVIGEDRMDYDSWIVASPGLTVEPDEYKTDIVVMEETGVDLNRTLILDVLELCRPSSERLDVCFVEYIDYFKDHQDVNFVAGDAEVVDGALVHNTNDTLTTVKVVGSTEWEDIFAAWQLKVYEQTKGDTLNKFRLLFHYVDVDNYDFVELNLGNGHGLATVTLGRRLATVESTLATCGTRVDLDADTYYIWRVQVRSFEDPTNSFSDSHQIKVLKDQDEIIKFVEVIGSTTPTKGNIGELSFKAHLNIAWKEAFQWPVSIETLRPALRIEPHFSEVISGDSIDFIAFGGGGEFKYSFIENNSGGSITEAGHYEAGYAVGTGVTDIIKVTDQFGKFATAFVDVGPSEGD
jgi:phage tail-like protein